MKISTQSADQLGLHSSNLEGFHVENYEHDTTRGYTRDFLQEQLLAKVKFLKPHCVLVNAKFAWTGSGDKLHGCKVFGDLYTTPVQQAPMVPPAPKLNPTDKDVSEQQGTVRDTRYRQPDPRSYVKSESATDSTNPRPFTPAGQSARPVKNPRADVSTEVASEVRRVLTILAMTIMNYDQVGATKDFKNYVLNAMKSIDRKYAHGEFPVPAAVFGDVDKLTESQGSGMTDFVQKFVDKVAKAAGQYEVEFLQFGPGPNDGLKPLDREETGNMLRAMLESRGRSPRS